MVDSQQGATIRLFTHSDNRTPIVIMFNITFRCESSLRNSFAYSVYFNVTFAMGVLLERGRLLDKDYTSEFGYYILFVVCRNRGNHCETTN